MSHQCTHCGHVFPDGSKEMLSGCPECGGNKFQFLPEDATPNSFDSTSESRTPDATDGAVVESCDVEDSAQAAARSSVVDGDDLPDADSESETPDDDPGLDRLREELNDQFESIRIVDHGQYELDLMELYKRDQFIIALQENGRYVIDVPESFRHDPEH